MSEQAHGHDLIAVHARLLERWRKVMNLVGPGPLASHYDDSERALAWLQPVGRWVDLGTGAGFPGIVFAARFPQVALELVDSRQKRCRFLEEVLAEAPTPHVTVRCARHEDLPAAGYDGVMSRALAAPEQMLVIGERLLIPGGTLVLFLQGDASVPVAPGWEVFHVEHYEVDGKARKAAGLRWRP
jgi:16S rRNA (guanine527-N7)-methyltransferase